MSLRATSPPVSVAEFEALVPSPSDTICQVIVKFFKFMLLEFKMHLYWFGTDGEITEAFGTEICLALEDCGKIGDTTSDIYVDDPIYGEEVET